MGHSIIKQVMAETGAIFGGEHSGHYYYRDNFRADSGIITALLVLELLSKSDQPLSVLLDPYRRYADSGEINTEVSSPKATVAAIAEHEQAAGASIDLLDGLTIDHGDWWYNVRPSNTEPLLRLTSRPGPRSLRRPRRRGARADRRQCHPQRKEPPRESRPAAARHPGLSDRQGSAALVRGRGRPLQPRLHKSYAVTDGVPVLLVDEAADVG